MNAADMAESKLEARDENDYRAFVAEWRGVELMPGLFRQFCSKCRIPFTVADHRLRDSTTLVCDRCPAGHSKHTIAGAFSPDRKQSNR